MIKCRLKKCTIAHRRIVVPTTVGVGVAILDAHNVMVSDLDASKSETRVNVCTTITKTDAR
jgi:hypothetical protein